MSIDSKRLNRSQKSSYLVCRDIIELKDEQAIQEFFKEGELPLPGFELDKENS